MNGEQMQPQNVTPQPQPAQPPQPTPQQPAPPAPAPPVELPGANGVKGFPTTPQQQPVYPTLPPQTPPAQPAPQPAQPGQPALTPPQPALPGQPPQVPPQPAQPETKKTSEQILEEWRTKNAPKNAAPDISKVPVDPKTGDADPAAAQKYMDDFAEKVRADAVEQAKKMLQDEGKRTDSKLQEQATWNAIYEKYPQVKENQQLRETIHTYRIGMAARGQQADLAKIADSIMETQTNLVKQGYKDAKTTTSVQQTQHLQPGQTAPPQPAVNMESIHKRMAEGTRTENLQAAQDGLKILFESGQLEV